MTGDDGWVPIFPKKPAPVPGEVELWGGPRDGERRVVPDINEAYRIECVDVSADGYALGLELVYRRRVVGPDEPELMPIRFDFVPMSGR